MGLVDGPVPGQDGDGSLTRSQGFEAKIPVISRYLSIVFCFFDVLM